MARFKHLVLVCTNSRDASDPRGDCQHRGAPAILETLKTKVAEHKLKGRVRVTKTGCLDYCKKGCAVAVFSEDANHPETWYTFVTPKDAEALFESHILEGKPLARLTEAPKDKS